MTNATCIFLMLADSLVFPGNQHSGCPRASSGLPPMLLSVMSDFSRWIFQVQHIVSNRLNHMTPNDYTIMLVLTICIGYVLLKGRS
jgi:hypothetical protein